jgi:hypothetical protein
MTSCSAVDLDGCYAWFDHLANDLARAHSPGQLRAAAISLCSDTTRSQPFRYNLLQNGRKPTDTSSIEAVPSISFRVPAFDNIRSWIVYSK